MQISSLYKIHMNNHDLNRLIYLNSKIVFLLDVIIWKYQKNAENCFSSKEIEYIYNKLNKIKLNDLEVINELIDLNIDLRKQDDLFFQEFDFINKKLLKIFFNKLFINENNNKMFIDFNKFKILINSLLTSYSKNINEFEFNLINRGLDLSDRYIEYQKMIQFDMFKTNLNKKNKEKIDDKNSN